MDSLQLFCRVPVKRSKQFDFSLGVKDIPLKKSRMTSRPDSKALQLEPHKDKRYVCPDCKKWYASRYSSEVVTEMHMSQKKSSKNGTLVFQRIAIDCTTVQFTRLLM